jgi:hypothetical protein
MANINIKSNQKVLVTANPKDASNFATTDFFNGPEWQTSDSNLINLSTTGFSPTCEVSAKGIPGVATVTIKGQTQAGLVTTSFTVTILAGPLDHFEPTFGTPVTI